MERVVGLTERLATGSGRLLERRSSRRGMLARSAVAGAALAVGPVDYLVRPGTAWGKLRPHNSRKGSKCTDGYTAFCSEIQNRLNQCPPNSYIAGWWKCTDDRGAGLCSEERVRYYIDCNRTPGTVFPGGCQSARGPVVTLDAHGIRIELPRGWSGRVFSRSPHTATLHAGDFQLPLDDGEFGDATTAEMPGVATFVALTEYRPGSGLKAGAGLFAPDRIHLPLDPAQFAANRLAHPRPGQVGAQQFFTKSGRPFCLYVVLAGPRTARRRQLLGADHVLRTLRISGAAA